MIFALGCPARAGNSSVFNALFAAGVRKAGWIVADPPEKGGDFH
jgi:hypothetical protein